ncbi:MAG: KxYKxGKxW signal peptide domain-containing protein [Streptococcaceae bacterium]|nr:KxYKxGKxW signal peptide domain-containing protein [Streptococcaceae bacterium]
MKSVKERKKLRKVKKKWVIISVSACVGILSGIIASANIDLLPTPLRNFIQKENPQLLEDGSPAQKAVNDFFGLSKDIQAGQSLNLNNDVIERIVDVLENQGLGQDGDLKEVVDAAMNVITDESNREVSMQQIVERAAEIVLPKDEQELFTAKDAPITPEIQKVVEHVEKIIELPTPEDMELKEDFKAKEEELEKLQKELEEKESEIQKIQYTNEELNEQIDIDKLALNDHKERIIELNTMVEERERERDIYKQEVVETETELRDVESKIAQTEDHEEQLKLKAKARVLKEKLLSAENSIKRLDLKIREDKAQLQHHERLQELLNTKIEKKKQKIQNNQAKIARLMLVASGTDEDFSDLEMPSFNASLEEKSEKVDEIQEKIKATRKRLKQLDKGEISPDLEMILSGGGPGGGPPPPPPGPGMLPPPPGPGMPVLKKSAVSSEQIKKLKAEQIKMLAHLEKAVFYLASQDSKLFDKVTGAAERQGLEILKNVNASLQRKLEEKNVKFNALAEIGDGNLNVVQEKYEVSDDNIFKDILSEDDKEYIIQNLNKEDIIVRIKIVESSILKAFYENLVLIQGNRLPGVVAEEGKENAETVLRKQRNLNVANIKQELFNSDKAVDEILSIINSSDSYINVLQNKLFSRKSSSLISQKPGWNQNWNNEHYYREGDTPEQKAFIATLLKRIEMSTKYKGSQNIGLYRPNDMGADDWINFLQKLSINKLSDEQKGIKEQIDNVIKMSQEIQSRWGGGLFPFLHRSDHNMAEWQDKLREFINFGKQKDIENGIDDLQTQLSDLEQQIKSLQNVIKTTSKVETDKINELNKNLRKLQQQRMQTQIKLSIAKEKAMKAIPDDLKTWVNIEAKIISLAAKPIGFSKQGKFGFYVGTYQNVQSNTDWYKELTSWGSKDLSSPPLKLMNKVNEVNREQKLQSDIQNATKELVQKFSSDPTRYPIDLSPYRGKLSSEDWLNQLNAWKDMDKASPANEIKEAQIAAQKKQEYDKARLPIDKNEDETYENDMKAGAKTQTVFNVKKKRESLDSIISEVQERYLKTISYADIMPLRPVLVNNELKKVQDKDMRTRGQIITQSFDNNENLDVWVNVLLEIKKAVVDGTLAEKFPELAEKIGAASSYSPTFEFNDVLGNDFSGKIQAYASVYTPLKSYLTNANTQNTDVSAYITQANNAINPARSALNTSLTEDLDPQIEQLMSKRQEEINSRFNNDDVSLNNDQKILEENSVKSKIASMDDLYNQYTASKGVLVAALTADLSALGRDELLQKLSEIENLSQKLLDQRTKLDQELDKLIKEIDKMIKNQKKEVSNLIKKIANRLTTQDDQQVNVLILEKLFDDKTINNPTLEDINKLKSYMPGGANDLINDMPRNLKEFKINIQDEFNTLITIFNFDRMDGDIKVNFEQLFIEDGGQNTLQTYDEKISALQYIYRSIYKNDRSGIADFYDAKDKGYKNKEEYAHALYDTLIKRDENKQVKLNDNPILKNRDSYFRNLGTDGYETKYTNRFVN